MLWLVQAAFSAFVAGSESAVWRWADDSGRVTLSVDRTSFVYGVQVNGHSWLSDGAVEFQCGGQRYSSRSNSSVR